MSAIRKIADLTAPFQHTELIRLAALFCGTPNGKLDFAPLQAAGFDVAELLALDWLRRSAGRWVTGFLPGAKVIREMWQINAPLCDVLGYRNLTCPICQRVHFPWCRDGAAASSQELEASMGKVAA